MTDASESKVALDGGVSVTTAVRLAPSNALGATLVLAHGAGAGQGSPFMVEFARGVAERGIDTVTFNFFYTEQGRRMPDRRPALEGCYRAVITAVVHEVESASRFLCIGGKSMGGRVATQLAASDTGLPIHGVVVLGYPLHPPGRPQQRRDAHLPAVSCPLLFVQGSRDTLGTPAELEPALARMVPRPDLHVVEGGDHSFKATKTGREHLAATYAEIQDVIVDWMRRLMSERLVA